MPSGPALLRDPGPGFVDMASRPRRAAGRAPGLQVDHPAARRKQRPSAAFARLFRQGGSLALISGTIASAAWFEPGNEEKDHGRAQEI